MPIIQRHDGRPLVELPPRPCESAETADACVRALCEAGRASARLLVDVGLVRQINGEVLGLLVRGWKQLGARHGDVVVIADELQRSVFTATRLDRLFVLAGSRDEAARAAWPEPRPQVAYPDVGRAG